MHVSLKLDEALWVKINQITKGFQNDSILKVPKISQKILLLKSIIVADFKLIHFINDFFF